MRKFGNNIGIAGAGAGAAIRQAFLVFT